METAVMPGKGELILTGHLGQVMKESARAALTFIRTRYRLLGLEPDFHEKTDIHIHVPAGASPRTDRRRAWPSVRRWFPHSWNGLSERPWE